MALWPRMETVKLTIANLNDAALNVPLNLLDTDGYEKCTMQLQTDSTACYISLKPWRQVAQTATGPEVEESFKMLPGEQIIFDSRHPFFGVEYYLNLQGTLTAADMAKGGRLLIWLSGGNDAAKTSRSVIQQ